MSRGGRAAAAPRPRPAARLGSSSGAGSRLGATAALTHQLRHQCCQCCQWPISQQRRAGNTAWKWTSGTGRRMEERPRRRKSSRTRQPRFSAPSNAAHNAATNTTSVNIQLDRFRRESTGAISFVPGTVQPYTDEEYIHDEEDPDYEFPLWWFFLAVPSQSFGPWIVGGTLWGIVVPHTIGENFGDHNKALVLATLGTLGTVMSFASPFMGSLSDRLPDIFPNFAARFGRRRPFFVIGQITGVTGIYFTYLAMIHKNTPLLFISWGVSNLSWQIAGPPYGAIFSQTIPESQRGLAVTINGWLCQICQIIGNGMGILLGEGHITPDFVWWFQIVIGYCQIPLACWAMSGRACSPFWWAKERMPTPKQLAEKAAALQKEREIEAAIRRKRGLAVARSGWAGALGQEFKEFISPFQTPAFRWLWCWQSIATIGGVIQGCFTFYWFQDCFNKEYYFLKWKVTNSEQTAVSVNGLVGAITNSAVSWSGNYWRDTVGGRQICLGFGPWALTGIIGFLCPFTYVLFSYPTEISSARILYTVVLFWTIWNNLFGGFASAGGGALGIDVLPVDPATGRTKNPARDQGLQGYAAQIPNVFLPMFLGGAMKWFPSHLMAFNTFYVSVCCPYQFLMGSMHRAVDL